MDYYELSVGIFKKNLVNLKHILQKGDACRQEQNGVEADWLDKRLAPDMFPLSRQITIACDNGKGASARLAGVTAPVMEDTETTVSELLARIDKTVAFLDTLTADQFAAAATREVTLPYFPGKAFMGHDYLMQYALPNFFFHVNMAYAILRAEGASLGKADYIGELTMHDVAA